MKTTRKTYDETVVVLEGEAAEVKCSEKVLR